MSCQTCYPVDLGHRHDGHLENDPAPTILWAPKPTEETRDDKDNKATVFKECMRELTLTGLAEMASTTILMFIGCSGQFVGDGVHPSSGIVGSASFGMAVFTSMIIFGDLCGAHMNPWVTMILVLIGKLGWKKALVYLVSQGFGAFIGYGLALAMVPPNIRSLIESNAPHGALCLTVPVDGMSSWGAILAEFLTTTTLLAMVCRQSVSNNHLYVNAMQSGIIVTILCIVEGPYTANSMNLTRSIPPAIWSGVWDRFWVFPVAHTASLLFVASIFCFFKRK